MCDICKCSWKGQDAIYVVRNPKTSIIKFGITTGDGSRRLTQHRRAGFTETISLKTALAGDLAIHIEQKIKNALRMVKAVPVRGAEYFSDEYVALILNEVNNWCD